MDWQLPVQIALDDVNGTVISTVDLKSMRQGVYETCVFFPDGSSKVVHRTRSLITAEVFHRVQVEAIRNQ